MSDLACDRREFLGSAVGTGAALAIAGGIAPAYAAEARGKVRVGVIGCGSVSGRYLPNLKECPYVEVVSVCDIRPERAVAQAKQFGIGEHHPHIDSMLAGAPFELFVNLTDMQEHEQLNRKAIAAGKHVWSEKPIANSLQAGQELLAESRRLGLRLWGAPIPVASPQFAFMAKTLAAGGLGHVASAHAMYGHTGPDWSAFFYQKGGGSMPDLGVYNMTTLTGLLGPAKSVTAMLNIISPKRTIYGVGEIEVTEEDNAMVLIEHSTGAISNIQCGFNFSNPHGHEGSKETRHTVSIFGSKACMGLVGYDWEPLGVDLGGEGAEGWSHHAQDPEGYLWQQGASLVAECLVTGKEPLFTPEHALHVVEIINAARESQRTGQRVAMTSTFKWPVVA